MASSEFGAKPKYKKFVPRDSYATQEGKRIDKKINPESIARLSKTIMQTERVRKDIFYSQCAIRFSMIDPSVLLKRRRKREAYPPSSTSEKYL